MIAKLQAVLLLAIIPLISNAGDSLAKRNTVIWKSRDVPSLDLIQGPGGRAHAPRPPFRFVKEDLEASSPKFDLTDAAGVKWKVKFGIEAQPETAASRLVWAAGYYTAEEYYLPTVHVAGVPATVRRGRHFIDPDGTMHGARFKRQADGAEKAGEWKWEDNPFSETRELNALRALMSLLNNWDVKDENNAIYRIHGETVYMVSDLGATFGAPGYAFPEHLSKGDLAQYQRAHFVCGENREEVDFCAPSRASLWRLVAVPEFVRRLHLRKVGDHIPRSDARWLAEQLSRLSSRQVRDAFLAAGYDQATADAYARVVERRIGELREM